MSEAKFLALPESEVLRAQVLAFVDMAKATIQNDIIWNIGYRVLSIFVPKVNTGLMAIEDIDEARVEAAVLEVTALNMQDGVKAIDPAMIIMIVQFVMGLIKQWRERRNVTPTPTPNRDPDLT